MKKYSIDTSPRNVLRFNAGSKPRYDALRTMADNGYEVIEVSLRPATLPLYNRLKLYLDFLKSIRGIVAEDEVVIQYPLLFYSDYLEYRALKALCRRCKNVTFLIHDIEFLRTGEKYKIEACQLNLPSRLIVHSHKMATAVKRCLKSDVTIDALGLFDYYSEAPMLKSERIVNQKNYIAYAGNLQKSPFLRQLSGISEKINWVLYGASWDEKDNRDNIFYAGKFIPDNPSILEAGWGLVWDGDTIETCGGVLGNYLRYNSPHKCSLYLSRGMPIIVWKESALASMVEAEHIGITVTSLHELETVISTISDDAYNNMTSNARKVGEKLRKGEYLRTLI